MGRLSGVLLALAMGACGGRAAPSASDAVVRRGEVAESTFAWPVPDRERRVEVEVRNAAGVTGMARAVTRLLRSRGFDVVTFGSHETASDTTFIYVRRGSPEPANRVREALGHGIVREGRDTTRRVDVSVILGTDYTARR